MRLDGVTEHDHGEASLSTPVASTSERDNEVRYRPGAHGHVESHFVKANSPDGQRALWIKHTLLVPRGRPHDAVAEVWAVAFDARGTHRVAAKQTFALAEVQLSRTPFRIAAPCASLTQQRAQGRVARPDVELAWDLALVPRAPSFRPFPYARMYTGGFPRSKTLTPAPDLRVDGSFRVGDQRWTIAGWRGAQGHNWGASHAHAYAWVHANAWSEEGRAGVRDGVWLEALSGRVRVGRRLVLPWLSVAGLQLDGELVRFDGLAALTSRQIRVDTRSYAFVLRQGDTTLHAEFRAETPQLAGLRYDDPDGSALACLNAKLAAGRLRITRGRRTLHLITDQAALELGTRDPAHGITLLA